MTRNELISLLARRLEKKLSPEYSDALTIIQDWDAAQKKDMVLFLYKEYPPLKKAMEADMMNKAMIRANEMMADNTLTVDELIEVFGESV